MPPETHIVSQSSEYIRGLFLEKLPSWVSYHDIRHTEETAEASLEIAAGSGLGPADTEIVLLGAWFHDTGYTETALGHEEKGAAIANVFLSKLGFPPDRLRSVEGCILATTVPQKPRNFLEQVVCDADMIFIGREEFFHKNDLLKSEMERRTGTVIEPTAWLKRSLAFLEAQGYHTEYCRSRLSKGLKQNVETLRRQLAAHA